MIELYLSSDGKHTVHVAAETQAQMDELAPYARSLYEQVLAQYGTKAQLWEAAKNGHAPAGKRIDSVAQAREAVAPRCPVHDASMRYRQGRYGAFWSCPTKQADGTWCSHTQEVPQPTNGQKVPTAHM